MFRLIDAINYYSGIIETGIGIIIILICFIRAASIKSSQIANYVAENSVRLKL